MGNEGAGEDRVFSQVLKSAAVARLPGKVDAAAERHVVALLAEFGADKLAVFVGGIGVPTGSGRHVGRKRGRVATVGSAGAHAVGSVTHVDPGNTQAGNADFITDAAIGWHVLLRQRIVRRHSYAVNDSNLFVKRHFLQNQIGALVRGKTCVRPRTGRLGRLRVALRAARNLQHGN